jgi:hypothetical protein
MDLLTNDIIIDFIRPALSDLNADELASLTAHDWLEQVVERSRSITATAIASNDPVVELELAAIVTETLAAHARLQKSGSCDLGDVLDSADLLDDILTAEPALGGELTRAVATSAGQFSRLRAVMIMISGALANGIELIDIEMALLVSFAAAATRLLATHRAFHLTNF